MTGIERLRKVAGLFTSPGIPNMLANDLNDIADQIERERAEDCFRMGERAAEDAEAAAWVRDHGGIVSVEEAWERRKNLSRRLETAQAKVERQQRHIESLQGKLSERRDKINVMRAQMAEMRPRLMPEGMEWLVEAWPRFEDGGPVRFSDDFERYGEENGVSAVTMYQDGSFALNCRAYSKGERVKRPTQKVLDADGAEIRVGDTVWVVGDAWPSMKVLEIKPDDDPDVPEHLVWCGEMCCEPLSDTEKWRIADQLTHRAPVLAADGRPLREGETVYLTNSPTAFVVDDIMTREDGATVAHLKDGAWHRPQDLTHERPDSWERLEKDVNACVCVYFGASVKDCENCDHNSWECSYDKARDLVRRAKKLAERGQ